MEGKMSKNILIIAFVSFIIGSLFGFTLVKELQREFIKTQPLTPTTPPAEKGQTVTGSVKFKSCIPNKTEQCSFPGSVSVDDVLLAIVGQNGKIIKTITTDKNGEAETEITVPVDLLFNINPKWPSERGVIHIVSFKKGCVETVLFNVPVFPGKWQIDENIIYDIPLRLLNPDPYQRNAPISIDRGGLKTWHRLEVDGFISSVAEALNLKAAYY